MASITYSADNGSGTATLTDGIVLEDKGTHLLTDPFAGVIFRTNAQNIDVTYYSDLYSTYPAYSKIGIYINGFFDRELTPSADGSATESIKVFAGYKTIHFINGPQSGVGATNSKGTFLTDIDFTDGNATEVSRGSGTRLMFYGDSISIGQAASSPVMQNAWMMQVREAHNPYVSMLDGRGQRSLHDDASTSELRATFVANAVSRNPDTIWLAIGTNDYGLERWGASDFGTAYGEVLDDLNTALPSATIYCQSPVLRSSEVANTFGDTLGAYRTAISSAVSTRTAFATYIDGSSILTTGDLADGVHPDQGGMDLIYATIASELSLSENARATDKDMNVYKAHRGAVEPAESGASGNEIQLWRGAVEPAAPVSSASDALIGGVTRSVTRTLTRGVTEGWSWGA